MEGICIGASAEKSNSSSIQLDPHADLGHLASSIVWKRNCSCTLNSISHRRWLCDISEHLDLQSDEWECAFAHALSHNSQHYGCRPCFSNVSRRRTRFTVVDLCRHMGDFSGVDCVDDRDRTPAFSQRKFIPANCRRASYS